MKLRYLPLLFIATPALAQQQFVPFTVDAGAVQQLNDILAHTVPPAYSAALVQWANSLEQRAQEEKLRESAAQSPPPNPAQPPKPEKGDKK